MNYLKMSEAIQKLMKKEKELVDTALSSEVASKIELWTSMYRNEAPWVNGKTVYSLNLPAAISSEIARLITLESSIEVSGSKRADFLNAQIDKIMKQLRISTEYAVAKGGVIFKPYVSPTGINVQLVQADCFFPLAFDDSGRITKIVFLEQFRDGQRVFTRLEIHELNNNKVTIQNRAFCSSDESILGSEVNLEDVETWSKLQKEMTLGNVDTPLYGYYRYAMASTQFETSPIGNSCFANAVNLIQEADRRYSNESWEFEAKEAAVNVAESLLVYDRDTGTYKAPENKERLYRRFSFEQGATERPFIENYSPDIRQEAFSKGINDQLRRVEFNCSLAFGTLSNPDAVDKTAEEIKMSKQRSYTMISDNQKALQMALEDLIKAMDVYATLYNLAPAGKYDTKFVWKDSILADADKERMQDMQEVTAGLMQKWEYRMKWYGETEEMAKKAVEDTAGIQYEDE